MKLLGKLIATFATGAAMACASTYNVRLDRTSVVNKHTFQPGVYRVDVDESNHIATIHDGRKTFYATVRASMEKGKAGSHIWIGQTKWVFTVRK